MQVTNDTTLAGFFLATAMPNSDWWQALWLQEGAGFASDLQAGVESARYILSHLAASGKITLTGKVNK